MQSNISLTVVRGENLSQEIVRNVIDLIKM